jgi:large subunit ribosomal protein L21
MNVDIGKVIVFDKVLLIGTPEYTSLGRPYVTSATVIYCLFQVLGVIEQQTQSKKIIIFKKKRRKGYQRNKGHRQLLTVVRILKIIHQPDQNTITNYHKL